MRSPWALSGLAVCGLCGATITALSHGAGKRRIRCAGRTQGNGCEEASCYAAVIEDQIGDMLQQFLLPDFEREQLLALWRYHQKHDRTTAVERARLQRKRGRLREAYLENELERDECLRRKTAVEQELAALPEEVDVDEATGRRLAVFSTMSRGRGRRPTPGSGTSWRDNCSIRW